MSAVTLRRPFTISLTLKNVKFTRVAFPCVSRTVIQNTKYVPCPRRLSREFTSIRGISFATVVTLTNLHMTRWRSSLIAASLLLIVGCATRGMSPANVAKLVTHIASVNSFNRVMSHYECTGPQRDWDYICEVRHDPGPGSSGKPTSQRVGLTLAMKSCDSPTCRPEVRGKPVFNESILPKDGPVPSKAELSALRKAQAENASLTHHTHGTVTIPSTTKQPVLAQPDVDQQAVARRLLSVDRAERNGAFSVADRIPPESVGPDLRKALIAFLERQNQVVEEARQAGVALDTVENPEFVANVQHVVARLSDPEAIPALARALGTFTVVRALVKFGEQAAPAVLSVVSSPESDHNAVDDGLRVLSHMVTGTNPDGGMNKERIPLSPASLEQVRRVVKQRLTGKQYFTTVWYAIDLAELLEDDAELRRLLEVLATDPTEVLLPVDDPKLIERTRGPAAEALARMRARSRP